MANQVNLEVQLQETIVFDFDLNDEANADLDLTGASVYFVLALGDTEILSMASTDLISGISIDSPNSGTGSIVITPADQVTVTLTPDVYNYEIKALLADLRTTVQIFGKITFLASLFAWPLTT